jgi:valyl-tRNA synthetase
VSTSSPRPELAATPDLTDIEARWRERWERDGIYRWDADGDGPVFSVDTPPPYVSAAHLHVGHAMSYAQADFVIRYQRMRGARVYYPIGFDDNGLPTERYVERKYGIDKASTSRSEFRQLCLEETASVAEVYEDLWRALGLSLDWSQRYSTIDDNCRRTAQTAFVRLHEHGRIYRTDDPVFWDPVLGTALAQADLEMLERTTRLYDIAFTGADGQALVISTTRPELLPACVAMYCHPEDSRYEHLIGSSAQTPLVGQEVPILTDEEVDPEFGTGLMMVCTFGDAEDVRRWRNDQLNTRTCLDEHGRFTELAGPYAGMNVEQARQRIVADLDAAGLLLGQRRITQRVAVSERSGAPVEFVMRPQWFLRLLDLTTELRERGRQVVWHPEWMRQRLDDWIEGFRYDWNLSRQRYYGVPFPVWICSSCDHAELAALGELPIDPLETHAPEDCPSCGQPLVGDPDVMDTWMTSSLTPQILTNWADSPDGLGLDAWPVTLRVQAHDIIRTWLFYTLAQSHLQANSIPWEHVMISGWGLNEQGKRISKRDLDPARPEQSRRYDPHAVIAEHGADALRHWAARGSLGHDARYSHKDVRAGRKHVLKLWNIARFCQPHFQSGSPAEITAPEDRWIIDRCNQTIMTATAAFESYDYSAARQATDDLLWTLADDWLEITKDRIWNPDRHEPTSLRSGSVTMHAALRQILGLYAPFLPFVTEELHDHLYTPEENPTSIHTSGWPTPLGEIEEPPGFDTVLAVLGAVRSIRSSRRMHHTTEIATVTLDTSDPDVEADIQRLEPTILAATRATSIERGAAEIPTSTPALRIDLTVVG